MKRDLVFEAPRRGLPPRHLADLDAVGRAAAVAELGLPPFRAKQLAQQYYARLLADPHQMTDLPAGVRDKVADALFPQLITAVRDIECDAGETRKTLWRAHDGTTFESVLMRYPNRNTVCISSQAGCALDCAFCSTGKQGFNRNLTAAEIIGQLWLANRLLGATGDGERVISNVVMMGMGEPLANFDNVVSALRLMLDDNAYGLSRRRVTVSTSGIVPAMDRLRDACPTALAVSLHASNDALRDRLVPINQKYPLRELMAACQRYLVKAPRDFITFEYVMLDGVNDTDAHARELVTLTRDVPCKFNLIPFNPFPQSGFDRSPAPRIRRFAEILIDAGIVTTTRKTRGDDVDAACGQLAGQVQDKTKRTAARVVPIAEVRP